MERKQLNVVITGASSGIGRSLATLYSSVASNLILIGRDKTRLQDVKEQCVHQGASVVCQCLDSNMHDSISQWLLSQDGNTPIDLLIANAGITNIVRPENPLEDAGLIEKIMKTNFFGTLAAVNPILTRMRKRKCGQVVIVCSLSAYHGMPFMPGYSASKSALKTYYESIRGQLRKDGITISIVCPSFVRTPMTDNFRINRYLTMSAEHAAETIKRGIDKGKAVISFPILHVFGLFILGLLPNKLSDWILIRGSGMNN